MMKRATVASLSPPLLVRLSLAVGLLDILQYMKVCLKKKSQIQKNDLHISDFNFKGISLQVQGYVTPIYRGNFLQRRYI